MEGVRFNGGSYAETMKIYSMRIRRFKLTVISAGRPGSRNCFSGAAMAW
jgi:hypothetical protein